MTVAPSIDPARFLEEHLAQASPDLLRDMLTPFNQHTALSRRRRRLRGRLPDRL